MIKCQRKKQLTDWMCEYIKAVVMNPFSLTVTLKTLKTVIIVKELRVNMSILFSRTKITQLNTKSSFS